MRFTIRDIRDKKDLRCFLRQRYKIGTIVAGGEDFRDRIEYDTKEAISILDKMIKKYKGTPQGRFIAKWRNHKKILKNMELRHKKKMEALENGNSNTN
jgi:hypothetical protein